MKTIADAAEFDREILRSPGLALLDFFTEACAPCRMLAPVFAEISAERPDLKVVKVDAGTNYEVASNFNISSVPTMILFRDGQPVGQLSGARSKKDLLAWIETTR